MNRRPLVILGVVALAMAVAVPLAFAHGPRGGGGEGRGGKGRGDFIKKELGLNDKQVEALKLLREDLHTDVGDLRDQVDAKRTALNELWKAPAPDRNKIVAATAEIGKLEAQIDTLRIDHMFAVKGELTPEQFAKFVELGPKHGKKWGRHGKGGKGGRWHKGGDKTLEGEVH